MGGWAGDRYHVGPWKWVGVGWWKCVGEWVDGLVSGAMWASGNVWVLAGGKRVCVSGWVGWWYVPCGSVEMGRCWLVGSVWVSGWVGWW